MVLEGFDFKDLLNLFGNFASGEVFKIVKRTVHSDALQNAQILKIFTFFTRLVKSSCSFNNCGIGITNRIINCL